MPCCFVPSRLDIYILYLWVIPYMLENHERVADASDGFAIDWEGAYGLDSASGGQVEGAILLAQ